MFGDVVIVAFEVVDDRTVVGPGPCSRGVGEWWEGCDAPVSRVEDMVDVADATLAAMESAFTFKSGWCDRRSARVGEAGVPGPLFEEFVGPPVRGEPA